MSKCVKCGHEPEPGSLAERVRRAQPPVPSLGHRPVTLGPLPPPLAEIIREQGRTLAQKIRADDVERRLAASEAARAEAERKIVGLREAANHFLHCMHCAEDRPQECPHGGPEALQALTNAAPIADAVILKAKREAVEDAQKPCTWRQPDDDSDVWCTACGEEWCFPEGGGPIENGMKFCHSCGGKLILGLPAPDTTGNQKKEE